MPKEQEEGLDCGLIEGVPAASRISVWCCAHGTITLKLFGERETPFATASVSREVWRRLAAAINKDCAAHGIAGVDKPLP